MFLMAALRLYKPPAGQPVAPAALPNLSDDELMLLCAGELQTAFEELIKRYESLIRGYTARFFNNPAHAREVAQEVFLTLWAERKNYKPKEKFRSYLLTITHFRCQEFCRKQKFEGKKRNNFQLESVSAPSATAPNELPINQLLNRERHDFLIRQLALLPDETRSVILFRFMEDLSYEEISKITGKPLGTLKSLVSRGVKQLSASFFKEDDA